MMADIYSSLLFFSPLSAPTHSFVFLVFCLLLFLPWFSPEKPHTDTHTHTVGTRRWRIDPDSKPTLHAAAVQMEEERNESGRWRNDSGLWNYLFSFFWAVGAAGQRAGVERTTGTRRSLINRLVPSGDKARLTWRSRVVRATLLPTVSGGRERGGEGETKRKASDWGKRLTLMERRGKKTFTHSRSTVFHQHEVT